MRRALCALIFVFAAASPVAAVDSLEIARELYTAAAYDEALAMLQRIEQAGAAPSVAELEQERALCLLALNRAAEADAAIAAVVQAQPLHIPDASVASPRVRTAFQEVRARLTPELARRHYARGRDHFDRGDHASAAASFDVVLALTDDLERAAAIDATLADLRVLARGFRALSEAEQAAVQAAAVQTAAAPAAKPDPEPEALEIGRIFDQTATDVKPPVPVKQQVPEWRAFMGAPPAVQGLVAITIDEQGRVEQADIIRSLHAAYDRLLLAAAREWTYLPATRAGQPVKFRKTIRLALR